MKKQIWWNSQREDPIKQAIRIIQENEPNGGYELAFSGGKDSVVLYDLAERAKVIFEGVYNATGLDPPELTRFIKEYYPKVRWRKPERAYFQLVFKKGMASRNRRWCCEYLKERLSEKNVLLGIRSEESSIRSNYTYVMPNVKKKSIIRVMPMLNWSRDEVWWYIKNRKLPYCSLYDEGFDRIGCIICPFLTLRQIKQSEERWPKYWKAYKSVLRRLYGAKKELFEDRYGFTCFEEFWWNWHGRRGPWPWKDKQLKLNIKKN